jgi:hypothetical protein
MRGGELMVTGVDCLRNSDLPAGHSAPLLMPMSEVAGRMAPHVGAHCLEKENGGRGVLLAGAPGVATATVVILGGGVAGMNAAMIASGMGADVTVLDRNPEALRWIGRRVPPSQRYSVPNLASQMRSAFSSIAWNTGSKLPGNELMTCSTSDVGESCSSASSRSRVSRATSVSRPAGGLRRTTAFGALLRFSVTNFRCRFLTGSSPALERFLRFFVRIVFTRVTGRRLVSQELSMRQRAGARTPSYVAKENPLERRGLNDSRICGEVVPRFFV